MSDGPTIQIGGDAGVVADEVVEASTEVLRQKSRSFRLASLLLPRRRRDDAAVLYALCRLVDDTADEADDRMVADRRLSRLDAELRGEATVRPLVGAFLKMAHRCDIDVVYARELIRGVRSDLGPVRMDDDRQLLRYCYRVAGTVGLMMSPLLGVDDRRARAHAIDLGVGMQLTNICRDVLEDARRNRVYLPADRLQKAGLTQEELISEEVDRRALAPVVDDLLDLAEDYYVSADEGMHYIPSRSRLAITVASRVYRAIGLKLRRNGSDPMAGRTVVGDVEKGWWTMRATAAWMAMSSPSAPDREHRSRLHRPLRGLPGVVSS